MDRGLRGPSRTAVMVAVLRAYHREQPPPRVLDDWMALDLAGEPGRVLLSNMRNTWGPDGMALGARWIAVRTRFVEDKVDEAVADGFHQYVLLGAGLDSFVYRRDDLHKKLRVFEVDHPDSQEWKRRRLAELGIDTPPNLVFAPVNFETGTLRDGLSSANFDFGSPAIFSWIGVTMYLTREAIDETLTTIVGSCSGTRLVLTYDIPRHSLGPTAQAHYDRVSTSAAALGEPFVSLFEPAEIELVLHRFGFQINSHFGPAEALRRYFEGHNVAVDGFQRLAVASVGQADTRE
jgi:methyltransferase (TIGR00027 family)